MKIMLLGRNGQVGWELQRAMTPLGELAAFGRNDDGRRQIDLTDLQSLAECIRQVRPDVIVNAAGYTDVDKAESDREIARAINALAPALLAEEALKLDACLVHYSTDYVFDGSGNRAWKETDKTGPVNVYGNTKLEGEQAIRQSGCQHLVLRTSWVYASRGKNFIKSILRLAQNRGSLKVVDDQVGSPTGAELIADATAHLVTRLRRDPARAGTYHLAAAGETSWYSYACFIVERARASGWSLRVREDAIEPVPSAAFPTPARRPQNSRLNCEHVVQTFDITLPPWRAGVERVLAEIGPRDTEGARTHGA